MAPDLKSYSLRPPIPLRVLLLMVGFVRVGVPSQPAKQLLLKLINSGVLASINGCVSTGKEANVYHAFGVDEAEYAVKVYKTSILVFKDRDRYVSGDWRWRNGYSKKNPRKMVQTWRDGEGAALIESNSKRS